MQKKKKEGKNLRLAGLFVFAVIGLVVMSFMVKIFFTIKESHFDGSHKFNVVFSNSKDLDVVSFSPSNNSFSILKIYDRIKPEDVSKNLKVPIDGIIKTRTNLTNTNISLIIFKTIFPLGNTYEKMTIVDLIRVFLFSRSVSENSIYVRELRPEFNSVQRSTVISLSFTDPAIYQENESIEIVNSTTVTGLGARMAELISNMGGNVILVSGGQDLENKSKIVYYGNITYTLRKLSNFLGIPIEESKKKGIADITIIIGKDSLDKINF